MPTLLHSVCPFPSTGKPVPETSRGNAKTCFLSPLTTNPTLSLKKKVSVTSTASEDEVSETTTFTLPDLNYKKITKRKLLHAYQLFVEMADKGHRAMPSLGKTLIYNLCSLGMFRKAVRIVELMLRSGTVLGKSVCTFIIENLTNIGAYEYAIQLLDEMEQRGCTLNRDVYNNLTMSLCQQEPTCQVWHCMDKLIQKGLTPTNPYVLSNLLDAAYLEGGADLVISVLYQILLRGGEPNLVSYNKVLTALKKENRVSEALELFSVLPAHMTSNVITYNILLSALGDQGRWREAEAILDSMMENGILPNIVTYKGLILVIANNGYPEEALEIAEELARHGFKTDEWCFNPVIAQFCSECRLDMVHKCLESMEKWNCPFSSGTYRAIALLCKKGMLDEAFDILESLRKKQGTVLHLFYGKVVLPYLCHKGNTLEAFQILSKLVQLNYTPNPQTISFFVKGLCLEGLHEEALEVFEEMGKFNFRPDVHKYNKLVVELCKGGRIDLAMKALEKMVMKGHEPKESTYVEIIEGIGNLGRKDIVAELLTELYVREVVSQKSREIISLKFCLDNVGF